MFEVLLYKLRLGLLKFIIIFSVLFILMLIILIYLVKLLERFYIDMSLLWLELSFIIFGCFRVLWIDEVFKVWLGWFLMYDIFLWMKYFWNWRFVIFFIFCLFISFRKWCECILFVCFVRFLIFFVFSVFFFMFCFVIVCFKLENWLGWILKYFFFSGL